MIALRRQSVWRWLRSWKRPPLHVLAAAAAVGLVAFLDSRHDLDADLAILYVAAVAAIGWWLGRRYSLIAAAASGAGWMSAALARQPTVPTRLVDWNAFTHFAIFVFAGLVMARMRRDRRRLRRSKRALEHEIVRASTDLVTNLPNSRGFLERLDRELHDASRRGPAFSIAMIDVDGLRPYHDRHEDDSSDDLVRRISDVIRRAVRASDTLARLDRDRFSVAFWDVDRAAIEKTLGRIIAGIAALGDEDPSAPIVASVGLACFEVAPDDPREALRRAETALRAARAAGPSSLHVWPPPEEQPSDAAPADSGASANPFRPSGSTSG